MHLRCQVSANKSVCSCNKSTRWFTRTMPFFKCVFCVRAVSVSFDRPFNISAVGMEIVRAAVAVAVAATEAATAIAMAC